MFYIHWNKIGALYNISKHTKRLAFFGVLLPLILTCFAGAGGKKGFCGVDIKTLSKQAAWISGKVPGDSVLYGQWTWSNDITCNGADSHKADAADATARHSFNTSAAIRLNADTSIMQYVYLEPEAVPSGIMLKLLFASKEVITLYWESDKEVFAGRADYISAWYMGRIPEPGKWVKFEIDCQELEIKEAKLTGMEFVVNQGSMWWGETIIDSPVS